MNLTQRHVEICLALHERHVDLARGDDDQRRKLTGMIAEQWCFEFGTDWGTKSSSPAAPRSKDALAHRTGPSSMDVWDWQNGSTREPVLREGQPPDFPGIADQVFIEVAPINHLGVSPVSQPGQPELAPREPLAALIELLQAQHKEQLVELRAIRRRLGEATEAIRTLGTVLADRGPR
jgi:hypothetical protein